MWAAHDIILGNDALEDSVTAHGDMTLYADYDKDDAHFVEDGDGDMIAHSTLTTTGSDIYIYGENIEVDGSVNSSGNIKMDAAENITLDDDVTATGTIKLKADSDSAFGNDDGIGDLWAKASITSGGFLEARGNNVTFDGLVSSTLAMVLQADSTEDGTGDLWAKDSVTVTDIGSGGYLQAYGNNVTFEGPVSSATRMRLIADSTIFGTDGIGDLLAKGSVTSGTSLEAYGNNVTFEGPVESTTSYMLLKADSYWDGTGDLLAKDSITSGDNLRAYGDNITFEGPASSIDFMWLVADSTGDGDGSVDVSGLVAGGDIDIHAADNTINIHKSADPLATADVHSDQDIRLWNNTVADADVKLYAGDDVVLAGGKTITGSGNLDIEAADDIMFGVYIATHEATDPPDGSSSGSSGDVTAAGNLILTAGDDIYARGELSTTNGGNITATADDNINLYNTPTSADADGTLTLTADNDSAGGGNLTVDGALYGNMELTGVNVTVYGDVVSDGILNVVADENIELRENVSSDGEMTMVAGDEIIIGEADAGDGNVTANGNMNITAGGDWNDDVLVYGKLTTTNGGNIDVQAGDDITIWGTDNGPLYESVDADGALTMKSNTSGSGFLGGDLYIAGDTIADSMLLEAGSGGPADYSDSRVQVDGLLQTTGGDMVVRAHHDIVLGGNVVSAGNLVLNADGHSPYVPSHIYGGDVDVAGTVDAVGTIDMYGNNIMLDDDVTSGGNMTLTADTSLDFNPQLGDPVGDVIAMGNLISTGGNIEIYSSDDTTYLGGDKIQAYGNILLNNNTEFTSYDDQKVDAQTGMITANGWLYKGDSSLYLEAAGDVSLAKYVTADSGGVSIVSETGTIFTPDEFGDPTDTLNVPITGYSNDEGETGAGVILPYGPGRAAIVVMSEADLKLGEGAVLTAFGTYGDVDDRAGVGFLDDGDPATATIGGILRNEGDPFDVAIYLASTDGDVDVSSPVTIGSFELDEYEREVFVPEGAMVIDAFDSVTFGDLFEDSLADRDVGDRLEVVSRITEWLFQAVGRLPYPYGGFDFPLDYTYVLRGAGLENPAITDSKRAWVLEDPVLAAPLHEELGEGAERLTLGLEGCPVLLAAAAVELGIPGETIEVSLANSFALNTDIQPCESCARLVNAATILRDEDGSRLAAMNQVFNTVAPAGAPFTPEMAASVVTAFAGRVNDGTQYATAIEYIDAFVRYIAVLSTEMGSPVGDSVAFVIEKYGAGLTESENSNIAAFVATRLESGETFGD